MINNWYTLGSEETEIPISKEEGMESTTGILTKKLVTKIKELKNLDDSSESTSDINYTRNTRTWLDFILNDEVSSSTSISPKICQMYQEFSKLWLNTPKGLTEDEESPFITGLKGFVERYGADALEPISIYISSDAIDPYLASDIMKMLGKVVNQSSSIKRRVMLEHSLKHKSPEVRFGAALGLANMNSKESISLLEAALLDKNNKKIQLMVNTIKSVIDFLKK